MKLKNRILIFCVFFIITIQSLIYINNSQKTSFRYFVWNIQEIRMGKLICISFMSGLIISTLLSNTIIPDLKKSTLKEEEEEEEEEYKKDRNNYTKNGENNNEYYEIPPERDLRETQPTISVNYRVIKNNSDNELKDISQTSVNPRYQDDWDYNENEW